MAQYVFGVTPYQGFEEEILNLRNRNRPDPRNRSYLDWRYLGQKVNTTPEIYWVRKQNGTAIGMASIIYRPYWIVNKIREVMILGDISLDKKYRGTGLADNFFAYIRKNLAQKPSPCGLVIPNAAAIPLLSRNGWTVKEKLVHHVYWINPFKKFYSLTQSKIAAQGLRKLFCFYLQKKLNKNSSTHCSFQLTTSLNEQCASLWDRIRKDNTCRGDKRLASLKWRYCEREDGKFSFITSYSDTEINAFAVFSNNHNKKTCCLHDIVCRETRYIGPIIRYLINHLQSKGGVDSVRIGLNESHPYSIPLKKSGFITRKESENFQVFYPDNSSAAIDTCQWMLSSGDKDV